MTNPHEHTGLSWMSARGLAVDVAITKLANAYGIRRGSDVGLHVSVSIAQELIEAQRAELEAVIQRVGAAQAAS
jgi:hypothetical protein